MEVASLQQHLGDSFSYGWLKCARAPSFERLVDAGVGHSFGSSRSFIDMDPAELFSMRWTATPASDFDFDLPGGGGPASPMLVSASQIFHGGRLLPCEPGGSSGVGGEQEDRDVDSSVHRAVDLPSAPRSSSASTPLFHSAQSTPVSPSSCSSATIGAGKHARPRPTCAGRRGGSSPWKVLLRYLRFLMPLYGKMRALRLSAPRNRVSPASPARGSTSSIEWCHGNSDTAVHDAILYCKKSSGQDVLP